MTKEELKLEALKYLENFQDCAKCKHRWGDCADELDEDCLINNCYSATPKEQDIYLAAAEPREKRIAELEYQLTHRNCLDCSNHSSKLRMRNLDLEKENADLKEEINKIAFARGNLEEDNAKLKEQIEKMKCGDNCKYGCMACGSYLCDLGLDGCNEIPFNCDKWELKEDVL